MILGAGFAGFVYDLLRGTRGSGHRCANQPSGIRIACQDFVALSLDIGQKEPRLFAK